jgi:hypothetical protein
MLKKFSLMKIKKLISFFSKQQTNSAPLLMIRKEMDESDIKEYNSLDEAIADLENDPNVSVDKIGKLREALKNLKNKRTIKIRNGEIIN